jgi:hypothetical protein
MHLDYKGSIECQAISLSLGYAHNSGYAYKWAHALAARSTSLLWKDFEGRVEKRKFSPQFGLASEMARRYDLNTWSSYYDARNCPRSPSNCIDAIVALKRHKPTTWLMRRISSLGLTGLNGMRDRLDNYFGVVQKNRALRDTDWLIF